jgi:hypothetical protein
MADFSLVTGPVYQWIQSGLFWVVMTLLFTVGTVAILWWKKQTQLKYNCFEIIEFGNGKIGINKLKAGVFKKTSKFFGLWEQGNESFFKTNDGRRILDARTEDLFDIMGKKGFICYRKADDPKILVPISRVNFKGKDMVMEIAPADYRDASSSIIEEAVKETNNFIEKYLPYIMLAGIVIFFVISMILASQFFNRTVDKASELLLQAGHSGGIASTVAP